MMIRTGAGTPAAPLIAIADAAFNVSILKLFAGTALTLSAMYSVPVLLQRMDNKVEKDQLKKKFSDYLEERILRDCPLGSQMMRPLAHSISIAVADYTVEQKVMSHTFLNEVLDLANGGR